MSQVINQSSPFGALLTDKTAQIDNTELRSRSDGSRLSPGLSLFIILGISAILWTGIILLVHSVLHLHLS
jgi:hypothetical protein